MGKKKMRNNFSLSVVLFLMFTSLYSSAQNRQVISLDGDWTFAIDSTNRGILERWENGILPQVSKEVKVPHTWNIESGTEDYAGLAWYQKKFKVPASWKNRSIRIKFSAVYHDAVVYVNGKKAGENLNAGYTPFTIDITKFVNLNETNLLVVSVNNEYSDENFPHKRDFDWANDGGIIRSVQLESTGKPSLRYVHVSPAIDLKDSTGTVNLSIRLWESDVKNINLDFVFREKKSGKVISTSTQELKVVNGVCKTTFKPGKINPWHFDSPNLYVLETTVKRKNEITDNAKSVFGFRKIEISGENLLLNGEKVRLPGIEYMPGSNPNYGIVEPRTFMDSMVRAMKDLNVCVTRFHWQQDDYMLSLMDEYGILVQEELPWWQRPARLTPKLEETARKQLADNIEAHYNHPSIFSWGISNEVNGNTNKDSYAALLDFVKNLDSTRFVTIISNRIWQKQKEDETLLGDLPMWNEYIGTWHGNDRNELPGKLDTVKNAIGYRPLMITENGLCEPANTGGDTRRIDDMLFHINEWTSKPYIIGYIYFCLNDYRTQMGEEGVGKYQIRRHGIMDVSLNPKPSYSVFKQLASPIDITKVERVNNTNALIEIKVKSSIPAYTLRSYRIQYTTRDNELIELDLPTLKPGDTYSVELKRINPRFAFKVLRPNGFTVIQY